jgi:hypothetical protein
MYTIATLGLFRSITTDWSRLKMGKKSRISAWWTEQGLKPIAENARNIVTHALDPPRVKSGHVSTPYITLEGKTSIISLTSKWTMNRSNQNTAHFVKMFSRRLEGRTNQPTKEFIQFCRLKALELTRLIVSQKGMHLKFQRDMHGALQKKGSLGRFLKWTQVQAIAKDASIEFVYNMWMQVREIIMSMADKRCKPLKGWTTYEMYFKNELLPPTSEGGEKITRLVQAPQYPLRFTDYYYIGSTNEMYASLKEKGTGRIGYRYYLDIPLCFGSVEEIEELQFFMSDFTDFDGSQSPLHFDLTRVIRMELTRLLYRRYDVFEVLNYIHWKYLLHVYRTNQSSWGCLLKIVGGLASGDVTTSDDNTIRAAFAMEYIISKSGLRDYKLSAQGDDTLIYTREMPVGFEATAARYIDDTGFNFKFMTISNWEEAEFLSTKPAILIMRQQDYTLSTVVVTRDIDRHMSKLIYSFDMTWDGTPHEQSAQISKLVSYMAMSVYMPIAWLLCYDKLIEMCGKVTPECDVVELPWLANNINLPIIDVINPNGMVKEMHGAGDGVIELLIGANDLYEWEQLYYTTSKTVDIRFEVDRLIFDPQQCEALLDELPRVIADSKQDTMGKWKEFLTTSLNKVAKYSYEHDVITEESKKCVHVKRKLMCNSNTYYKSYNCSCKTPSGYRCTIIQEHDD